MAMTAARGRAGAIAGVMRQEAAFENKPNHVRHVENQIRYADSVSEAVTQEIKEATEYHAEMHVWLAGREWFYDSVN